MKYKKRVFIYAESLYSSKIPTILWLPSLFKIGVKSLALQLLGNSAYFLKKQKLLLFLCRCMRTKFKHLCIFFKLQFHAELLYLYPLYSSNLQSFLVFTKYKSITMNRVWVSPSLGFVKINILQVSSHIHIPNGNINGISIIMKDHNDFLIWGVMRPVKDPTNFYTSQLCQCL